MSPQSINQSQQQIRLKNANFFSNFVVMKQAFDPSLTYKKLETNMHPNNKLQNLKYILCLSRLKGRNMSKKFYFTCSNIMQRLERSLRLTKK